LRNTSSHAKFYSKLLSQSKFLEPKCDP
jgi:hypothetical protein